MKTSILVFLIVFVFAFSCKNDKDNNDNNSNPEVKKEQKTYDDKEIEKALYEGFFMNNENGFDVTVIDNNIYFLKNNPSDEENTNNFFIEIKSKNITIPNLNLSPDSLKYNNNLSVNFKDVTVYKAKLPIIDEPYDILVGQFSNTGRTWHTYLPLSQKNTMISQYKNQYVSFTKSNRYLNDFEEAFNQGYFIKSPNNFDVLLEKHTVYFIKPNGQLSDLDKRFYLHLKMEKIKEMQILDFDGKTRNIEYLLGKKYENFIVVKYEIPFENKITELGAGQFDAVGRSWGVLHDIEKLYEDMNFIYNGEYDQFINSLE